MKRIKYRQPLIGKEGGDKSNPQYLGGEVSKPQYLGGKIKKVKEVALVNKVFISLKNSFLKKPD